MRSRLAPSPTGAQHLGNARTYLFAWMHCRQANGELILRIEDLDTPRTKSWARQQIFDDLRWLGIDWEIAPPQMLDGVSLVQSERGPRYGQVLQQLIASGRVYPCICTRSQIEQAQSAPHENSVDGPIYPGTCRHQTVKDATRFHESGRPFCWRIRVDSADAQAVKWHDGFAGPQCWNLPRDLGDFVVARANGEIAYQLAVVIDDHDMKISHVVRGDDLLPSTARQILLYRTLGWQPPEMLHVPLVLGEDGRRLAKRHGDTRLSRFRDDGIRSDAIVGFLAWSSGLLAEPQSLSIDRLLELSLDDMVHHAIRMPNEVELFRVLRSLHEIA